MITMNDMLMNAYLEKRGKPRLRHEIYANALREERLNRMLADKQWYRDQPTHDLRGMRGLLLVARNRAGGWLIAVGERVSPRQAAEST